MNDRVYKIRNSLNMTMEAFGERLGVTRSTISRIEKGVNNVTEQMMKSICREFKVNYFWLRDGIGDMFNEIPDTILDELADEYKLDNVEKEIISNYLKMDKETRHMFVNTIKKIFTI